MRIETFPLIIGVLFAMLGIGIIFDAWTPDAMVVTQERRRRRRIERHRNGEAMIGFGVLALAAALMGRDNWRYSILVVIIGALFLIVGTVLNGQYVRELLVNRGPWRRREFSEGVSAGDTELFAPSDRERPIAPLSSAKADQASSTWDGAERRKAPRNGDRISRRKTGPTDGPLSPNP